MVSSSSNRTSQSPRSSSHRLATPARSHVGPDDQRPTRPEPTRSGFAAILCPESRPYHPFGKIRIRRLARGVFGFSRSGVYKKSCLSDAKLGKSATTVPSAAILAQQQTRIALIQDSSSPPLRSKKRAAAAEQRTRRGVAIVRIHNSNWRGGATRRARRLKCRYRGNVQPDRPYCVDLMDTPNPPEPYPQIRNCSGVARP